ncbi:MAG: hypothetical protein QOJ53_1723, partial [Sphingomonadales bacterium]|nr:hypothetical protein [Sphingomonadales bacterium]
MPGRYYEQWTLGDRIRHQPHRTVTETDNLIISALTHNPQPLLPWESGFMINEEGQAFYLRPPVFDGRGGAG